VGTPGPTWATPTLWNLLSENSAVLWQSLQAALPTNRRAPRSAATLKPGGRGEPSRWLRTHWSNCDSLLISLYS
jgi:hypothetical protein